MREWKNFSYTFYLLLYFSIVDWKRERESEREREREREQQETFLRPFFLSCITETLIKLWATDGLLKRKYPKIKENFFLLIIRTSDCKKWIKEETNFWIFIKYTFWLLTSKVYRIFLKIFTNFYDILLSWESKLGWVRINLCTWLYVEIEGESPFGDSFDHLHITVYDEYVNFKQSTYKYLFFLLNLVYVCTNDRKCLHVTYIFLGCLSD